MRRRNKLRGFKGKKQLANNSRTWRVCSMSSTLAFSALTHFITNSTHSSFRRLRTKAVAFHVIKASSLHEGTALFNAAKHTVDTYVKSGMTIGLGSGQASALAIQYMGRQLRSGALKDILGIPMSVASASEAAKSGIPLDRYQDNSQIDFAFGDADVVEEETLVAVIGQRKLQDDESIIEEKSILNAANTLVFMVGEQQYKSGLECSIPILIQSLNWMNIAEEIDDLFLGDAEVWRRPVIGHAGPSGGDFPLITGEGHNILDLIFTSPIESLGQVAESLDKIDGVVGHGVISKSPCTAVIVSESGLRIVDNVPTNEIRVTF